MSICKRTSCSNKAACRGLCRRHWREERDSEGNLRPRCRVDGCVGPAFGRGLCSRHWQASRRRGDGVAPVCVVDGCGNPSAGNKMCFTHYQRVRRYGDPSFRKAARSGENATLACLVSGCLGLVVARGYCNKHHLRVRIHGNPDTCLLRKDMTPEESRQAKREAQRRYKKTPHGRLRARHNVSKRRIMAGAMVFRHISKEDLLALWSQEICALCGKHMTDEDKSLDHKIPVSRGGDHSLDNLQMTHLRCNQRKSNKMDFNATSNDRPVLSSRKAG